MSVKHIHMVGAKKKRKVAKKAHKTTKSKSFKKSGHSTKAHRAGKAPTYIKTGKWA